MPQDPTRPIVQAVDRLTAQMKRIADQLEERPIDEDAVAELAELRRALDPDDETYISETVDEQLRGAVDGKPVPPDWKPGKPTSTPAHRVEPCSPPAMAVLVDGKPLSIRPAWFKGTRTDTVAVTAAGVVIFSGAPDDHTPPTLPGGARPIAHVHVPRYASTIEWANIATADPTP